MARINIEESLRGDRRFIKLISLLNGDYEKALGAVVHLWSVAQTYWKKDQSLIPDKAWRDQEINPALLQVGLAEKQDHGYYAAGSKENFDWLLTRVKSGRSGGKRSGEARRNKSDSLERSKPEANASKRKQTEASPLPLTPPLTLSPTQPLAPTHSQEEKNTNTSMSTDVDLPSLHWLIHLWNEHSGKLPKVKQSNSTRNRKIQNICTQQDVQSWILTIQRMSESDFCNGKNNTGWKATFDFLLQPETWLKVNEGKYDNNKGVKYNAQEAKYENLARLEKIWDEKEKT